jgi:RimJ/RimL family protein N-acetyltransferase
MVVATTNRPDSATLGSYSRSMLPLTLPIDLHEHGVRLRRLHSDDATRLAESRNDPVTAAFQSWETPFPLEKAVAQIDEMSSHDTPTPGAWMNVVIADRNDDTYLGDVGVNLSKNERAGELGYTLSPSARGRGLATVAAQHMIKWLFSDPQFGRVSAEIHPDNVASARVLERLGFIWEGCTRQSYWVGDAVSDNAIYGLLRSDREAWNARTLASPKQVQLIEITPDNVHDVTALRTHKSQERFVAPVIGSLRDALLPEVIDGGAVTPWYRAIEADGVLAGFMMVADTNAHHPHPYLWRLLVDRMHQGRGIGQQAMLALIEQRRQRGDTRLMTSWVPGHGSPAPLYLGLGFIPTGIEVDGEIEGALALQ